MTYPTYTANTIEAQEWVVQTPKMSMRFFRDLLGKDKAGEKRNGRREGRTDVSSAEFASNGDSAFRTAAQVGFPSAFDTDVTTDHVKLRSGPQTAEMMMEVGNGGKNESSVSTVSESTPASMALGQSMSLSGELGPMETIFPQSRFRCLHFLNQGSNGFVVLAQERLHEQDNSPTGGNSHDGGARVAPIPGNSPKLQKTTSTEPRLYALKFMELKWEAKARKYVEREILNQFKLKHPHVIKLEEIFMTETHLALVLEYADGGDMFQYVKQRGHLSEAHARWFFQQIILAMDYCHQMGIVNRDIKLENILLTSNQMLPSGMPLVKLSDFGFSKDEEMHSAPQTRLGTPMYIAPEVLRNKIGGYYDGKKCDVWGAGVVLHVMLTGQYPFLSVQFSSSDVNSFEGQHEMMTRIKSQDYRRIPWLSTQCNELLDGLLDFNPRTRLSTTEIMQKPWFTKSLGPAVAGFNDKLVARHKEQPRVTPGTIKQVRTLMDRAAVLAKHHGGATVSGDSDAMDSD